MISHSTECKTSVYRFSALQRAENSSIYRRYFRRRTPLCFSALQRAENSSIDEAQWPSRMSTRVSVLFSEPKIPQSSTRAYPSMTSTTFQCSSASRKFLNSRNRLPTAKAHTVSVLFSEPKIPQSSLFLATPNFIPRFSALQRAENSSIKERGQQWRGLRSFQCSSASRNSSCRTRSLRLRRPTFQCSSASRKFLNPDPRTCVHPYFRPR